MICRICFIETKLKHLPLYVSGSEGIDICHNCEMVLVEYLRSLIRIAERARKAGYMESRRLIKLKEEKEDKE